MTIFEKILAGEIPGNIEFEDEHCFVLHDINPQAPTHFLVIPKKVITRMDEAQEKDAKLIGHLLLTAQKIAHKLKLSAGFRIIINNGPQAGETVPHLHVHVLGGRSLNWPPG